MKPLSEILLPAQMQAAKPEMLQLPDAELGQLIKHWADKIKVGSDMLNRTPYLSAALLLVEMMTDSNAAQMDMTLEDCDLGDNHVGDWRIRIERV